MKGFIQFMKGSKFQNTKFLINSYLFILGVGEGGPLLAMGGEFESWERYGWDRPPETKLG